MEMRAPTLVARLVSWSVGFTLGDVSQPEAPYGAYGNSGIHLLLL